MPKSEPNYLSVDANGKVIATFAGISLPSGTGTPAADQTRIIWNRQSDGAVIAEIVGYDNPAGVGEVLSRMFTPAQDVQAINRLTVDHASALATVTAEAFAGGVDTVRTVINSAGGSSFGQLGDFIILPRVSANAVGADGQQICGWNVNVPHVGAWILAVWGTGFSAVAGVQTWFTTQVNGVNVESGTYTYAAVSARASPIPAIGRTPNIGGATNVTVVGGPNFRTQAGFDQYTGIMVPTQ